MPKTTVAAIITQKTQSGSQILLTRRAGPPFQGQWCLPGGHIDLNEPARDAVIREVKEEVGLCFDAKFFDYFDEIIEPDIHAIVLAYDGPISGDLLIDQAEVVEAAWFDVEKALSTSLAFRHNQILARYFTQDKEMEKTLREEKLTEFSALRSEMRDLLNKRYQILVYALTAAGIFIGAGAGDVISPPAILVYPLFSIFLVYIWAHTDVRIGQIGTYIRENIEKSLPGIGWENYIHSDYQSKQENPVKKLVENYTIGVFFFSQLLAILVGITLQISQLLQVQGEIETFLNPMLSGVLIVAYLLFGLPRMWKIVSVRRKRY